MASTPVFRSRAVCMNSTTDTFAPAPSPRAFAYCRLNRNDPCTAAQRATALAFFRQHLEQHGYGWGGSFEDAAEARERPLRSRPWGSRLSTTVDQGDVVVVAVT